MPRWKRRSVTRTGTQGTLPCPPEPLQLALPTGTVSQASQNHHSPRDPVSFWEGACAPLGYRFQTLHGAKASPEIGSDHSPDPGFRTPEEVGRA